MLFKVPRIREEFPQLGQFPTAFHKLCVEFQSSQEVMVLQELSGDILVTYVRRRCKRTLLNLLVWIHCCTCLHAVTLQHINIAWNILIARQLYKSWNLILNIYHILIIKFIYVCLSLPMKSGKSFVNQNFVT